MHYTYAFFTITCQLHNFKHENFLWLNVAQNATKMAQNTNISFFFWKKYENSSIFEKKVFYKKTHFLIWEKLANSNSLWNVNRMVKFPLNGFFEKNLRFLSKNFEKWAKM